VNRSIECNSYGRNNQSVESAPPSVDLVSSVGVTDSVGVGERSIFASRLLALPSGPRADSRVPLGDADACRHSEPPSERTARGPGVSSVNTVRDATKTNKGTHGAALENASQRARIKHCTPRQKESVTRVTHVQSIETAEGLPAALTSINLGFCRV
jgi:hypothetical protein